MTGVGSGPILAIIFGTKPGAEAHVETAPLLQSCPSRAMGYPLLAPIQAIVLVPIGAPYRGLGTAYVQRDFMAKNVN